MRRLFAPALRSPSSRACRCGCTDQYFLHVLITTGIFTIAAMSLNLLLGYTGQLSLGHVAFFGIGAYASALTVARLRRRDLRTWTHRARALARAGRLRARHLSRGLVRLR